MEKLRFLTPEHIQTIQERYPLPVYVYSEEILRQKARECLDFPNAYGLTVRYAMKANSNLNILKIFDQEGLYIDASSSFEAHRAMEAAGISPQKIQLTTQEFRYDLAKLIQLGISYNATSLYQLQEYGKHHPGTEVSIRINPGAGSGFTKKTSTGGTSSSFGIWHEYLDKVKAIASAYQLTIYKLHIHIGSGSDPKAREKIAKESLSLVEQLPDVKIVNLGGGFKVARMQEEKATDLQEIGAPLKQAFEQFYHTSKRKLHLEIEPGSFLVANAGAILGLVEDVVDTGEDGFQFIKSDIGMPDILRPTLYAAQHPIVVSSDNENIQEYVVVGPCCESGDILTPSAHDPQEIATRKLPQTQIGDALVVEGTGAYCASMSAHNYNSYPIAPEVLIKENGEIVTIRKGEDLKDIWKNEIDQIG